MTTENVGEKMGSSDLNEVLGPAYARDLKFWQHMLWAVVIAVVMGFVGLAFMNIIDEVPKLWLDDSLDDAAAAGFMDGTWWWVGLSTAAGFVVGVLRAVFLPKEPAGFINHIKELDVTDADCRATPAMWVISAVSLACGASLGPEAAMGNAGATVGKVLAKKVGMAPMEQNFTVLVGMAAAFGPLLPGAYLGVVLLMELRSFGVEPQSHYMNLLLRLTLASTLSYGVFTSLADHTFLQLDAIPAALYEFYDYQNWHLAAAVMLGFVAAAIATVGTILLGAFRKIGENIRAKGPGPSIAYATIAGMIYGAIGVCLPLTFGSGSAQLSVVIGSAEELGKSVLTATLFAKMFTLALCLSSGFVGGFVFPMIFQGAVAGVLANLLIPKLPLPLTVSTMMAAVPAAIVPAPFSMALLIAQSLILGARDTQPVVVAVFSSHLLLAGFGLLTRLVARQEARKKARADKAAAKAAAASSERSAAVAAEEKSEDSAAEKGERGGKLANAAVSNGGGSGDDVSARGGSESGATGLIGAHSASGSAS